MPEDANLGVGADNSANSGSTEQFNGEQRPEAPSAPSQSAQSDKFYTKDQLVRTASIQYEAGKKAALEELAKANQQKSSPPPVATPATSSQEFETLAEKKAEEIYERKKQMEMQAQIQAHRDNLVSELTQKLAKGNTELNESGEKKYPDYDAVLNSLDYKDYPYLPLLLNNLPNPHDVLYAIAKDPVRHANLLSFTTSQSSNSRIAANELKKLSDSLIKNSETLKKPQPKAPLAQEKPSNNGLDSGKRDASYWRSFYKGKV